MSEAVLSSWEPILKDLLSLYERYISVHNEVSLRTAFIELSLSIYEFTELAIMLAKAIFKL